MSYKLHMILLHIIVYIQYLYVFKRFVGKKMCTHIYVHISYNYEFLWQSEYKNVVSSSFFQGLQISESNHLSNLKIPQGFLFIIVINTYNTRIMTVF